MVCDASVDSVTVTARVEDAKWFKIVDPTGCQGTQYQETIGIVNITAKDAHFSFYSHKVPALSPPFIIVLAVIMSIIAIAAVSRRGEK
ncbi:MAG: hypothetical protein KAT65_03190 [Methanophagales archaeon]|nr:hypothetical protein [Methanophagales archaeon]